MNLSNATLPDDRNLAKVLANEQYRKHWPLIGSFMAASRDLKEQPVPLVFLQVKMASELRAVQESKRTLRDDRARLAKREEDIPVDSMP
ncbi:MAG: hypothetical protein WEE64_02195 [Dehalococcoidia bacterium]